MLEDNGVEACISGCPTLEAAVAIYHGLGPKDEGEMVALRLVPEKWLTNVAAANPRRRRAKAKPNKPKPNRRSSIRKPASQNNN